MLLEEDEGSIQTLPVEGENDNPYAYANEEEQELYTFLLDNNLLIIYDQLKALNLYIDHLTTINVQHPEFDDLCGDACLELNNKPHLKIRLKTAIQSLRNERVSNGQIAEENKKQNNDNKKPHFYPSPVHIYPSPYQHAANNENENDIMNYIDDIEENDNKPVVVNVVVNYSYRIMIFLRFILWIMDHFIMEPQLPSKQILVGGSFGSFLLFVMSISGMYNICKNPPSKKSGSLSIMIACSELFYFMARDSLSHIFYQDLYRPKSNQLYNFGVHAMVTLLLSCCLGHIVWKYRSEIFEQIHSSKWNLICNYLMFGWVVSWELTALKEIASVETCTAVYACNVRQLQVEKTYKLLNIFFWTENAFLLAVILLAPPIKAKNNN